MVAAALVLVACSANAPRHDAGSFEGGLNSGLDGELFVPQGLSVTALAGGNGVLDLYALTLRKSAAGTELYAALKNNGDMPACSAAVAVELFDTNERSLAAGIGGLLSQHFYRLTDGSDMIAACVAPGEVTMAALTDLPSDLALEDVGHIVYRCPYFALDVVPIEGLSIREVRSTPASDGTTYAGTLVNGLEVAIDGPSISVFPVSGAGRPLGVATASSAVEIPPGGSWSFRTNAVDASTTDYLAFPAGALAR